MRKDRLEGKVAIVTGAAKGLGSADVEMMIANGAVVYAVDCDAEGLAKLAKRCGTACRPFEMDVSQRDAWHGLVEHVTAEAGALHILVNNAGVVSPGTIVTQTEEQYRKQMAVSADGTFFGCQACLPLMTASGGGSIINMCSIASVQGEHYVVGYSAAKGAVEAMTRAIAVHCALNHLGVRCNSIHPSGIDTPMVQSMPGKMVEAGLIEVFEREGEAAGGSMLGEPRDIAAIVTFLASDEARFINGAAIRADLGMSIIAGVVPPSTGVAVDAQ